jgi:hypothetical protein
MGNRERFCARARYLAVLAALAISVAIAPAMGDIPPDTGLGERQAAALAEIGPNLVPERPYPGLDRSDCVTMQNDGFGLVARLELDRRGLEGGVDPATAAPWARYMAEAITRLVGTGGVEGVCAWNNAGAPGIMNATAALAYAMHRYGSDWPDDVKEAIRAAAQDASWGDPGFYLANGRIANVAAELLAGEALGLTDLFDLGVTHLEAIFDRTMRHGGIEMNAPLYTAHHFPILIFLQVLGGERARTMARILLEYELLVQAHMYLPGGALGAPQSRDYSGGAADGGDRAMLPVMWLLVGDPELEPLLGDAYDFVVAAATDYAVPESIRAVFLEKDEGFDFWVYTDAQQGESRTPYAVYDMGLEGARAIPWEDVVMPGGTASMGVSFGYRLSTLLVTSGAYVRAPGGPFGILYQFQPMVGADTDDDGDLIGGSGINDDPDDFTCELYDFERLVYEATAISLWDPSARTGVVRTYQDTRVHIPDWAAMGGEALSAGAWRVGRLGDVYAAYMPLGTVAVEEVRGEAPDTWTYMRLDGRSGGIVELAMVSDFATIGDYAADLEARHVDFTPDPLAAEVDALDPDTGGKVRVRLEFRPERRIVAGAEISVEEALDHGLMQSSWATWTPATQVLRLSRGCYPTIVYDWGNVTITVEDPPPECGTGEEPEGEAVADLPDGADPGVDAGPDATVDAVEGPDAVVDPGEDGGEGKGGGGCGCAVVG